jgi:hypothetical protein
MTGHQAQHTQHVQHAQHTQVRNQNHGAQRDNRGRKEPRSFDRDTHHRIDSRRYRDTSEDVQFEGYWFTCDLWPEWVFEEDVYVVMGPNDVWFLFRYGNPAFIVQVRLVE